VIAPVRRNACRKVAGYGGSLGSIGDPVTGKSMEPETTKCSPLVRPTSIRTTEVSESDCLHLTHCPTPTNIGSDLKTEWTFADVGR
jgi:hypothetical protein